MATRHAVAVTTTDFRPPHYHPLPLSKISSALVYYITPAPLAIQHCCYQPPHRYYHVDNSNAAPSNHVRIIATHYYHCRWLITNISMINDNINRHNSPLLCHSISVCYHHWSNVKQRSWCWLLSWWLLPCQNDFIYNCLENSHHYLTFFLSTAYTYSNHHNNPPKNSITFYTLSIFHTAKKKHTLHTLNVERFSNEWRAPFVLFWRSIYIGIGEVGGINLLHLASTWCQRHIWRSWSRGTPHRYFHTAPTRCCVGLRGE